MGETLAYPTTSCWLKDDKNIPKYSNNTKINRFSDLKYSKCVFIFGKMDYATNGNV
jgi:hypothetical protein